METIEYLTPLGSMQAVFQERFITELKFPEQDISGQIRWWENKELVQIHITRGKAERGEELRRWLQLWFAGTTPSLEALPLLDLSSSNERRLTTKVHQFLRNSQFGERFVYGDIAAQLGAPGAARAVGSACAKNPLHVLVPCHRVVHKDGRLAGYAGGLLRKRMLLEFEQVISNKGEPLN